jgi:hypothetical protein
MAGGGAIVLAGVAARASAAVKIDCRGCWSPATHLRHRDGKNHGKATKLPDRSGFSACANRGVIHASIL